MIKVNNLRGGGEFECVCVCVNMGKCVRGEGGMGGGRFVESMSGMVQRVEMCVLWKYSWATEREGETGARTSRGRAKYKQANGQTREFVVRSIRIQFGLTPPPPHITHQNI